MSTAPTLRTERELLRGGARLLAAVDEVGRGSLAGPVTVGVVVVGPGTRTAPAGVRDSKLLTAAARQALAPRLRRWALDHAVGSASAAEIDAFGIVPAMRLAGERALASLSHRPDLVLLDGNHDWLTRPPLQIALFDPDDDAAEVAHRRAAAMARADTEGLRVAPPVVVRVKADRTCSSVAAASVLAKTDRDALMVSLAPRFPEFGWEINKGYASPDHLEALERHGPCPLHRRSWRLRGRCDGAAGPDGGPIGTAEEAMAG